MSATTRAPIEHVRQIQTPEGIPIPFAVATAGDRIVAFLIDVILIHVIVVALLLAGVIAGFATGGVALSFALVGSFVLRNFYFVYMELRWGGQTIGKRKVGLRVISRDGGPLTGEAVLARNLTRDLEVFLPLTALANPTWIVPAGPGWGLLLSSGWLFVFALLPLFNRDRLRCGDLVGGTMVVRAPNPVLLPDLAQEEVLIGRPGAEITTEERYRFTVEQLDLYGIRELQVLEEILRTTERYPNHELLERVSEQIRTKIGWEDREPDPEPFLRAFYKAQRAHLEHRMLLGDRRERKKD